MQCPYRARDTDLVEVCKVESVMDEHGELNSATYSNRVEMRQLIGQCASRILEHLLEGSRNAARDLLEYGALWGPHAAHTYIICRDDSVLSSYEAGLRHIYALRMRDSTGLGP